MIINRLRELKQNKLEQNKLVKIKLLINNYQFGKSNPYELIRKLENILNQNE